LSGAGWHVFDEADDRHDIGSRLACCHSRHGANDGCGTSHVPLHILHAACGLDGDATRIEANALADERDRFARAAPAPLHRHEKRRPAATLADGKERPHPELLEPGGV
jgi:hypothetical protein